MRSLHPLRRWLTLSLAGGGLALALAGAARAQPAALPLIWIEGEDAAASGFNNHGWYCCEGLRRDLLSPGEPEARPGAWLAHYANSGGRAVTAEYRFDAPAAGRYVLWLRASAYTVRMQARLDGGAWQDIDTESDPREYTNLLVPDRIDIRFLAWFRALELDLAAGQHSLTIGLAGHPARQGGQEVHGGLDVVALADPGWTPAGALRPEQLPTPGPDVWFPLIAADDPFSPDSVTDMSHLLERPAGRHGPVQARGPDLAFADGTPVRFWGVNAQPAATEALQRQQARFYAKQGVNLVRLHPVQSLLGLAEREPSGTRRFDPERLARLDRWFAILKEQGIYSTWSVFYPHVITAADGYDPALFAELTETQGGRSTSGFVNFMRPLQDAEWAYLSLLLDHVNPHTGLRYADDPALAIVEVHNEDSVFWHYPLNDLEAGRSPRHLAELQRQWAAWLSGRYADDAALLAAWGPANRGSRPGDSLANPRMAIYGAWEMAAAGPVRNAAERARMGDFIRFLAETQRSYFERRGAELRGIGFQGLRASTAWQAGGAAAGLANLYTDMGLDIVDRHRYAGGLAPGSHVIKPGAVQAASHLAAPGSGILGAGFEQAEGQPFMVTEWTQSPPNPWKAEIAPLVAFYGFGLQGWDAQMHFAARYARFGSGWPLLDSYVSETPHYFGQFPALALAVARGDLARGQPVAERRLRPDEAFRGEDRLAYPRAGEADLATPAEAFAIGPVTTAIGEGLPAPAMANLDAWWDRAAGRIESTTGELVWHSAERVVEVRSPRSQGLIGFGGGRTWSLPGLEVELATPFASLLVTSLDGAPIAESSQLLVTALARDRQLGTRYSADGSQLEALGGAPLLLEPVRATLTFGGAPLTSARPLDIHGVPREVQVERSGNRVTIDGRYQAYLYEIRRAAAAPPSPSPSPGASPSPTMPSPEPTTATPSPSATLPGPSATPGGEGRRWLYLPWLGRGQDAPPASRARLGSAPETGHHGAGGCPPQSWGRRPAKGRHAGHQDPSPPVMNLSLPVPSPRIGGGSSGPWAGAGRGRAPLAGRRRVRRLRFRLRGVGGVR